MEYTDMDAWNAAQKEVLIKIGQVEDTKTTKSKKDEE